MVVPAAAAGIAKRAADSFAASIVRARWSLDRTVPTGHSSACAASSYVISCRSHSTRASLYGTGSV